MVTTPSSDVPSEVEPNLHGGESRRRALGASRASADVAHRARELAGLLAIWDNPVFQRFCRSRLRLRKAIFWYLLTAIVTTFMMTVTYIVKTNSGISPRDAAADLWLPLLIIQGLILMMKGTGAVSAGLIQDKIDQTLDYQRLTPLSPLRNVIGYLFGLPVLEYVMAALTLPHLMFVVVVGEIPLAVLFTVYLAFFTCVALYHMTGIAVGMVMRKWILGYLLSIFMVLIVNVVLPLLFSQFGLKFLQYLSVWPVIGQKVLPVIMPPGALTFATSQNPFFAMADAVPFYDWTLSPFIFTLLLQGTLIVTFAIMALRRWQSSMRHSLSKPYALVFLCGFIVLLLGNVWQAVTGQRLPFPIFGETDINELREAIAIGLPLVYCLVVWLLCIVLFSIVIPSHHAYVRGIRRAQKMGRPAPAHRDDDSASLPFMSLFVTAALIGFFVMVREIDASGFFDFLGGDFNYWRLPTAFGLVLVYTVLLLQVVELKPSILVILLVWVLPVLVAIVFGAATQYVGEPQAVVASVSPLVLLVMAGFVPLEHLVPPGGEIDGAMLTTGVYSGLVFIALQIAWLWRRWRKLQNGFDLWLNELKVHSEEMLPQARR